MASELAGSNVKNQLDDQAKTLMPRNESQTLFRGIEDRLLYDESGKPLGTKGILKNFTRIDSARSLEELADTAMPSGVGSS